MAFEISHYLNSTGWKVKNILFKTIQLTNDLLNKRANTYIIFGTGRSGTTWLAEIFKEASGGILINEPLKNQSSYKIQKLGFTGWGQYIPEDLAYHDWESAFKYFDKLLKGREYNPNHVNQDILEVITKNTYIIKFIRANYLMPWLVNNFMVNTPIYIVRNPFATIYSQLNHGGWGKDRDVYLKKKITIPKFIFYEKFYANYQIYYDNLTRIEELLALRWCNENSFIINHPFNNTKWKMVFYEYLVNQPGELKKICNLYGFTLPNDEVVERSSNSSITKSNHDRLFEWKTKLDPKQRELINNQLKKFGLENLYNIETGLPNPKFAK